VKVLSINHEHRDGTALPFQGSIAGYCICTYAQCTQEEGRGIAPVQVMLGASKGAGLSEPDQLLVFPCMIHLGAVSQALADTSVATDRHSVPITLHTKLMDIACTIYCYMFRQQQTVVSDITHIH
jgi:hypothetical protein